ncbi:MAG: hypothetical protein PHT79_09850 [Syntrophomonadaceae bacterium]|nr:hypothetical protein [Syntrophomonadaceae bacterium]MDD3889182.1 hypothetical protein [Syntrophomonadaceae bacterium]MDD4550045.1 hypothetical protein [Syntrophomonadaceae bacterium]
MKTGMANLPMVEKMTAQVKKPPCPTRPFLEKTKGTFIGITLVEHQ